MKKTSKPASRRGMRPEYDFTGGVRGKYAARFRAGTNIIVLDPDVAAVFESPEQVNRALRALLNAIPPRRAQRRVKPTG